VPDVRPGARRFTRADWDAVFGQYDAVTDVGCIFAEQLVAAYPDAKVLVVERDFDKWWESYAAGVSAGFFHWAGWPLLKCIEYFAGNRAPSAMRKTLMGAFDARSQADVERNARRVYGDYYRRIRQLVPPERRLEFKHADGWEPLCRFLGKEVPDMPFPRLNDRGSHRDYQMKVIMLEMGKSWEGGLWKWCYGGLAGVVGVVVMKVFLF
jgi:hypothetical protein